MTSLTKKGVIRDRITLHAMYIMQRYSNGNGFLAPKQFTILVFEYVTVHI